MQCLSFARVVRHSLVILVLALPLGSGSAHGQDAEQSEWGYRCSSLIFAPHIKQGRCTNG